MKLKTNSLLLSSLFSSMLSPCLVHADDDAAKVSVGKGSVAVQSAQFQLSQHPTFQFVDGKAVMTLGEGANHIAELPMSNGAQLSFEGTTYDESTNIIPVTVSSADYGTLYSAFQLTVPEGIEVYAPTYNQETKKLQLNNETLVAEGATLPAGTGVILKNAGSYSFSFSTSDPSSITSVLHGSAIEILTSTITDGTVYSLAKEDGVVAFYHYTGDNIVAGKAFLVLNEGAAQSKAIMFDFGEEDIATGISEVNNTQRNSSGVAYNLAGQRVNPSTAHGIVIINGKKYSVK